MFCKICETKITEHDFIYDGKCSDCRKGIKPILTWHNSLKWYDLGNVKPKGASE